MCRLKSVKTFFLNVYFMTQTDSEQLNEVHA